MLQLRSIQHAFKGSLQNSFDVLLIARSYSSRNTTAEEEIEFVAARKWFADFDDSTIPTRIATTTYSRSSGPGGQKTNKTSSKATTVWPFQSLTSHIPETLHGSLRSSRYYVASSNSISIQSDVYRGQTENTKETHRRLHDEIIRVYKSKVPGVTSEAQKQRVEVLQKAQNASRLREKKYHSSKKQSRTGGRGGES